MTKASGGDGIAVELFQILTDDAVKVLHSICQQIWKTHQWPQDWKRSVFLPIPKKSNAKECSNHHIMAHISHASKVMLKIFQASLQEYVNHELQMFNLDLEKAEEPEMGMPDHLTCLRRNLYTGQEATVRIGYGTIDWFQIRKGVHQGYQFTPYLFYLYAEYIM